MSEILITTLAELLAMIEEWEHGFVLTLSDGSVCCDEEDCTKELLEALEDNDEAFPIAMESSELYDSDSGDGLTCSWCSNFVH